MFSANTKLSWRAFAACAACDTTVSMSNSVCVSTCTVHAQGQGCKLVEKEGALMYCQAQSASAPAQCTHKGSGASLLRRRVFWCRTASASAPAQGTLTQGQRRKEGAGCGDVISVCYNSVRLRAWRCDCFGRICTQQWDQRSLPLTACTALSLPDPCPASPNAPASVAPGRR